MIPAYLYIPKDNLKKKLPINKNVSQGSKDVPLVDLLEIAQGIEKAFRSADAFGGCHTNLPFTI